MKARNCVAAVIKLLLNYLFGEISMMSGNIVIG